MVVMLNGPGGVSHDLSPRPLTCSYTLPVPCPHASEPNILTAVTRAYLPNLLPVHHRTTDVPKRSHPYACTHGRVHARLHPPTFVRVTHAPAYVEEILQHKESSTPWVPGEDVNSGWSPSHLPQTSERAPLTHCENRLQAWCW